MKLGQLIEALRMFRRDTPAPTLKDFGSYRGFYEDLYLDLDYKHQTTVGELVDKLDADVLDTTQEGYKGGNYYMDSGVDVYIDSYGRYNRQLVTSVAVKSVDYDLMVLFQTTEQEF